MLNLFPVALVHCGLIGMLTGAISVVRPIHALGHQARLSAVAFFSLSAILITRVARGVNAAVSFQIAPAADEMSDLTTETRVFAADPQAGRAFAAYWRMIYPGSALIRVMWLRAIRLRAEA